MCFFRWVAILNMLNLGGSTNVSERDKPCLETPQNSKTLGQNSNSKRMSLQKPRFNSFYRIRSVRKAQPADEAAGRTFFSFASGVMVRPLLSLFFLMYLRPQPF